MSGPPERRDRQAWIDAALEMLRDEGVERVRVEPLALRLGVTKGSFYWHFKSRSELIEAALDAWVEKGTESIIREVSSTGTDPLGRLRKLWSRALRDPLDDMRTELAIRELGQRDAAVSDRVRRVDERRMQFLREHFVAAGLSAEQAEARSLTVYSLMIGNFFIEARHGRLSRGKVLALAFEGLLADL